MKLIKLEAKRLFMPKYKSSEIHVNHCKKLYLKPDRSSVHQTSIIEKKTAMSKKYQFRLCLGPAKYLLLLPNKGPGSLQSVFGLAGLVRVSKNSGCLKDVVKTSV